MVSLTDYFSSVSTEDYVTASFRSDGTREEDCQVKANDENFLVPPVHLPVHGEEPTSVKFIQCQYTVKQKQLLVPYARHHRVCPTERKFGIP